MRWFSFIVVAGSALLLLSLYRGAFFVPTRRKYIPRIVELLGIQAGETVADLGSGDGRLLIAVAEAGGVAHGFEHNPFLVWRARRNVRRAGFENKAFTHHGNFWNEDLSSFNAVVIYGIPYIMGRLEKKLLAELRPGARVVSNSFPFPTWQPTAAHKRVYLYRQP
ncbi:MAG: methyltransferase domain-containing protein [Patescibacteria group bacterium]